MSGESESGRLDVRRIVVMVNCPGTDTVFMYTDLPSPFPPGVSDEPLSVTFAVRSGYGIEYVKAHFPGVPLERLDQKTGKRENV